MSRKIKFTKQYKPIRFGDRPDPGTVEGHRNAMAEGAETRVYKDERACCRGRGASRRAAVETDETLHFEVTEMMLRWLSHGQAPQESHHARSAASAPGWRQGHYAAHPVNP